MLLIRSRMLLQVVGLLLVAAAGAVAQPVGGYAGGLLRRPAPAREVGMGGAFDPFRVDASAIFSNAAALSGLEEPSVTLGTSVLPFGQRIAFLGAGYGFNGISGIGISVLRYGVDDISRRPSDGRAAGTMDYQQLAVAFGGGLSIGPGSVGATVRYIRSDVIGVEAGASGYSIDLSGTIAFRNRLFFSLALNNIAGEVGSALEEGTRDLIPWNTRLGALYLHPLAQRIDRARPDPTGIEMVSRVRPTAYWLVAAEVRTSQHDSLPTFGLAGEVKPLEEIPLALRAGLNTLGDVSGGFSYAISTEYTPELRLDYAVRRDYELGDITHHVTFTARFP